MGGPSAGVFLPEPLSPAQLIEIDTVIRTIGSHFDGFSTSTNDERNFVIADTRVIGGNFVGSSCVYSLEVVHEHRSDYFAEFDVPLFEKRFGFTPRQLLNISAGCNGKEDHQLLGTLLLYFADKYQGVVDFNGALIPQELWFKSFEAQEWSAIAAQVDTWLQDMPGRIYPFEYDVAFEDKKWVSHIADTAFLRAWMQHPNFRMIK